MYFFLICFILSVCFPASAGGSLLVCITETEHLQVHQNGQRVDIGGSVSFDLETDPGWIIRKILPEHPHLLKATSDGYRLELRDVRYPLRLEITLLYAGGEAAQAQRFERTITYDPGMEGAAPYTLTCSILEHPRPNTDRGLHLIRPGFTLTGWRTPSGETVSPGSRVDVPLEGLSLKAVWQPWAPEEDFTWEAEEDGAVILTHTGHTDPLVVPGMLGGLPVRRIAAGAFRDAEAETVILPRGLETIDDLAFAGARMRELTLSDDLRSFSDRSFADCKNLTTLHILAATDPYGYAYRRESCYADKIDLLLDPSDSRLRLVFYGGCNVWYNLIGSEARHRYPDFRIVNLGLNGTVNGYVQMSVLKSLMKPGDILFHAPEISSTRQLLLTRDMYEGDDKLWSGLEYNYDLFSLVDLRGISGVFDSLAGYLSRKQPGGTYDSVYLDAGGNRFMDDTGSVPLLRTQGRTRLEDHVDLDLTQLENGLPDLARMYEGFREHGIRVYVSWACVNIDAVPSEHRDNVAAMDETMHGLISRMSGPVLISHLQDYLFHTADFFDTQYHLLTQAAYRNTESWLRDLDKQLLRDGLTGFLP